MNPLVNTTCLFVPGPMFGVRDTQMNKPQTLFSGPEGLVNLGSLPLYKWVNVRDATTIMSSVQYGYKWGREGSGPPPGDDPLSHPWKNGDSSGDDKDWWLFSEHLQMLSLCLSLPGSGEASQESRVQNWRRHSPLGSCKGRVSTQQWAPPSLLPAFPAKL